MLSLLILATGAGLFFWYGQPIVDAYKASRFTPSTQLASIRQRVDFSERGTQIFYATSPAIEQPDQFNKDCQSQERTAAILGCYTRDRIYLYAIDNKDLDGALESTAAHEMLHAAYQRLNPFDRQWVDGMVRAEYEKIKDQPDIKDAMSYYAKAEPGSEIDELHSIIGTTIADISPEFESYYARYFEDRAALVELSDRYNSIFDEIDKKADALRKKIDRESKEIKISISAYDTDLSQLNLDIQSFNQRAKSGGFTTQQSFESARNALMQRVTALNARQASINARVAVYNNDIDELNKLSVRANELNSSINGVVAPGSV